MVSPLELHDFTREQRQTWPSNEERRASWFANDTSYSDHRWEVKGINGKICVIDFMMPVANGKLLIEHESLYRTAKEFAFWVRQHPESDITSAKAQQTYATEFLTLCCALTYRGIFSFATIDEVIYRRLIDDWRYGSEGLLKGSERVREFLSAFNNLKDVPEHLIGGSGPSVYLAREKIMVACGLPEARTPQIRWEMDQCALRLKGLRLSRGFTKERPPLATTGAAVYGVRKWYFRILYDYRHYLRAETIGFRPQTLGIGKRTKGNLKRSKPTKVVPPELMFKLLSYAADFVAQQMDHIDGILASHYLRAKSTTSHHGLSTKDATNVIKRFSMAVYLLIAVFTARRPEEVDLLQRNCLGGNDRDGWSLHVYIVKNLNDWVWVPIPPIVATAIKALLKMLPDSVPSDPLFRIPDITLRRPIDLDAAYHLRLIAADADAISYKTHNGKPAKWTWVPRQTRRFTAALFFWRYEGQAEVVQHILRHVSLGDTRPYIEKDAELAGIWEDEAWRFTRRLTLAIAEGTEQVTGPMGNRLMRMRELIKAELHRRLMIVDPERLADGIQEIMRREMLVIIPKSWVICSCPATSDAAAKAMCRKQPGFATERQIGPDFLRAGPGPCATCYWGIQTSRTREVVAKEVKHLALAAASPARVGTVFASIERKNLAHFMQLEKKDAKQAALTPSEAEEQ
ncbi:hypothetical protein GR223_23410 [Rhizobium leguminosarum]|uniref:hypothetical protein n=1 Tax=Rhizobium ruizarguesonis TaxID=2081791 RepID=UPI0013E02122|nr:hypothetical protein [Rhizobium ruizarguesonis]NEJ88845.1 hypothetical protein [Rhizobium ruizarguesonis]